MQDNRVEKIIISIFRKIRKSLPSRYMKNVRGISFINVGFMVRTYLIFTKLF